MYSKATYFDPILQARISGTDEQKLIRSRASKKAAQTRAAKKISSGKTVAGQPPSTIDDVLTYVEELLSGWTPLAKWSNSYTTLKENDSRGVPIVAQWIKNPATIHEDLSLIPTFAQWDKVLALP